MVLGVFSRNLRGKESALDQIQQERAREGTHKVPSVGIEPPTPVPRQKRAKQSHPKVGAKADAVPKTALKQNVRWKAGTRP